MNDTGYADADDVAGDIVLSESISGFDGDDLVLSARVDRRHSDFGTGQTTGALDTNADGNTLILTATDLKGRVQIEAAWHDRFGRATGRASYGTNGDATFNRTTLSSVPASADNNPASTTVFGDDGRVKTVTDALGHVTYREYDALGRVTKEVQNYSASVNSGNPSGADDNQTVRYEYVDGLRTKIIADVPSPGTDQETVYTYGTVKGRSAGDSKIATGHLLQKVAYPDSTGVRQPPGWVPGFVESSGRWGAGWGAVRGYGRGARWICGSGGRRRGRGPGRSGWRRRHPCRWLRLGGARIGRRR